MAVPTAGALWAVRVRCVRCATILHAQVVPLVQAIVLCGRCGADNVITYRPPGCVRALDNGVRK